MNSTGLRDQRRFGRAAWLAGASPMGLASMRKACWAFDRHYEGQAIHASGPRIGGLRRSWALETQRIIPATALMHHLPKRINAQRLGLSTCKTGALPLSYGPMLTYA
jgi:hypothetical protein